MAEVILRNVKRQPFLTTVLHDIVCRRRQSCGCKISYIVSPKGKRISAKQPDSFQINALSELKVDAVVLHLPHVKAALKRGWLVRKEIAVKAPVAAQSSVPKPAPVPEPEAKNKKGRR